MTVAGEGRVRTILRVCVCGCVCGGVRGVCVGRVLISYMAGLTFFLAANFFCREFTETRRVFVCVDVWVHVHVCVCVYGGIRVYACMGVCEWSSVGCTIGLLC